MKINHILIDIYNKNGLKLLDIHFKHRWKMDKIILVLINKFYRTWLLF
jgi:hypothetical protein